MKKRLLKIIVIALLLWLPHSIAQAGKLPVIFSWGKEKLARVESFPQTEEFTVIVPPPETPSSFLTNPGSGDVSQTARAILEQLLPQEVHIDAGARYKQVAIFFIPVFNYDIRWCGYVNEESYVPMSREELATMTQTAGITLSKSPSLPLWDSVGGKLLVVVILLCLFCPSLIFSKTKNRNRPAVSPPGGGGGES